MWKLGNKNRTLKVVGLQWNGNRLAGGKYCMNKKRNVMERREFLKSSLIMASAAASWAYAGVIQTQSEPEHTGSTQSLKIHMSSRGPVQFGDFEEVLSIPGRYLNDHCLIREDNYWHLFGIVGSIGSSQNYSGIKEISFVHASSRDLLDWKLHPDVIEVTGKWPETSQVWAPYVIKHNGLFYMLYTAVDDISTQRISLATSKDLLKWERYVGNPVIVPSLYWARWPGFDQRKDRGGSCRDPHILRLEDGPFIAYWVGAMRKRYGEHVRCVAASISEDLVHWQEIGPVFMRERWDIHPTDSIESPCVIFKDGLYWLFYRYGWWTHVVSSNSPYDFRNYESVRLGYCHASEVLYWDGNWWITHCSGDPKDYMYRKTNRTRGLFIGRLNWPKGEYPRLINT